MSMKSRIRFLSDLKKLAIKADKWDVKLPNGAEVGSLLGSMADDLENAWFPQEPRNLDDLCACCGQFPISRSVGNLPDLCEKCATDK